MKRKAMIALLMSAMMAIGTINAFALDYYLPEDAVTVTSRFSLAEPEEANDEFVMISEDGQLIINITANTLVYFEGYVPLSDECDGVTRMVREVLFGRTLAEVLDGRNLRVIFVDAEQIEPISIMILFETAVPLLQDIDPIVDPIIEPSARTLRFAIDTTTYTDNGVPHTLEAAPFIANDRTMVPLRVISEALGAADLAFDAGVITFNINGSPFTMTVDQPLPNDMGTPVIVAERTFVPLAFIVNEMGASARWDDVLRAAYIYI